MSNNKYDATFFDPTPREQEVKRRGNLGRHVAKGRKHPLWAQILAALILVGVVFWVGWGIGAGIDYASTAADCREELQLILDEAGSDRAPTEAEVEACVAQR